MMKFIYLLIIIFSCPNTNALLTDGVNTSLLMSIMTNTGTQLVRLEELLKKSDEGLKYTNEIKNATETLQDKYDLLSEVEDTLVRVANIPNTDVEELRDVNDMIEDVQDKRSKIKDLLDEAKKSSKKDDVLSEALETSKDVLNKENESNKKQFRKSFGPLATKNQTQATAQNTSLINMKLSKTNLLLEKLTISQMKSNKLFADELKTKYSDQEALNSFMFGKKQSIKKVK